MRSRLVALGSAVAILVAACGDGGSSTTSTTTSTPALAPAGPPFPVTSRVEQFADPERPTAAHHGVPEVAGRALPTTVFAPDVRTGRFPLLVFSHGNGAAPSDYTTLLTAIAEAGYVVAAPTFPLSNRIAARAGDNRADVVNQPADVSFVITQMLRHPRVDGRAVGLAGHSLGAITTAAVAANGCCRDARVKAAVALSVLRVGFSGAWFEGDLPPLLVVHGDADATLPYKLGRAFFEEAKPPKFLVTILGGAHSPPFRDGPPDPRLVQRATVDFLDTYLKRDRDGLDRLTREVASFPFARLEAVPS